MAKNAGKKWAGTDIHTCQELHIEGWSIALIAQQLGRIPFAIECQLKSLGLEPHTGDMSARAFNSEETAVLTARVNAGLAIEKQVATSKVFFSIPKLNEEKCTMKAIETVTYVKVEGHRKDVKDCEHEDIIHAIKETKRELDDLTSVNETAKSAKMDTQIEELKLDILALAKIYDAI